MDKDKVFADRKKQIKPFEFNEKVTQVFDDMLTRSVPFYEETILRQAQMAFDFFQKGSRIYDLGCSHGNLGVRIIQRFGLKRFFMVGVDSSYPMIRKYARRLGQMHSPLDTHLVCGRLEDVKIEQASVVLINLTLQFLEPGKRDDLIKTIYEGMIPGGILLLTEKTVNEKMVFNELEQAYYRQFKLENGYSELEISQKREALEKVLVPDSQSTHFRRLRQAGFSKADVWLKWFNFSSIMAVR